MDEDRRVFFAVKIGDQTVNLVIKLALESKAQKTIHGFYKLITSNVYKGAQLDRIISPEFIIQGGGVPNFNGELSRSEEVEESTTQLNKTGLIAVASDVYQEKSSEFFITLDDLSTYGSLKERFIVLGQVENGLEKLIELTRNVEVDENDRPLERFIIIKTGELQKKTKEKKLDKIKEEGAVDLEKHQSSKDSEEDAYRSQSYDDRSRSHRSQHRESSHRHSHRKDRSPEYRDRDKDRDRHRDRDLGHRENRSYGSREYEQRGYDHYSSHRSRHHNRDYSDRDHKRLKKSSSGTQDEVRKGRGFR